MIFYCHKVQLYDNNETKFIVEAKSSEEFIGMVNKWNREDFGVKYWYASLKPVNNIENNVVNRTKLLDEMVVQLGDQEIIKRYREEMCSTYQVYHYRFYEDWLKYMGS